MALFESLPRLIRGQKLSKNCNIFFRNVMCQNYKCDEGHKKGFVTNNKVLVHRLLPNKNFDKRKKNMFAIKRQLFTTFKRHFKSCKKLFKKKEMKFPRHAKVVEKTQNFFFEPYKELAQLLRSLN